MTTAKWADATLKLLQIEQEEDRQETATLLATLPAKELQRRGIMVPKLRLGGMRTGLGGRR